MQRAALLSIVVVACGGGANETPTALVATPTVSPLHFEADTKDLGMTLHASAALPARVSGDVCLGRGRRARLPPRRIALILKHRSSVMLEART